MKDIVRISIPLIFSIGLVVWTVRHRGSALVLIVVVASGSTWFVAAWLKEPDSI